MEYAMQAEVTEKMEKSEVIHEFYYSLVTLQSQATQYVARGENDEDKVERAKTVVEMVREMLKKMEETGLSPQGGDCVPPDRYDPELDMCIRP